MVLASFEAIAHLRNDEVHQHDLSNESKEQPHDPEQNFVVSRQSNQLCVAQHLPNGSDHEHCRTNSLEVQGGRQVGHLYCERSKDDQEINDKLERVFDCHHDHLHQEPEVLEYPQVPTELYYRRKHDQTLHHFKPVPVWSKDKAGGEVGYVTS